MASTHDIASRNMRVSGKELTVYFSKAEVSETNKPCRFCGARPAFVPLVKVVEIYADGYAEITPDCPMFLEAQEILRKNELHDKPTCFDHLCEQKHMHELLGDNEVYNMICTGEYVPDAE